MLDPRKLGFAAAVALVAVVVFAFGYQQHGLDRRPTPVAKALNTAPVTTTTPSPIPLPSPVPLIRDGGPRNIYRYIKRGNMSPVVKKDPPLVYVPNGRMGTVEVIDPKSFKVIRQFSVGSSPQHVTPSWDLRWLYVDVSHSNALAVIDPRTGKVVKTVHDINFPYNLYFTVGGHKAIVVTEALDRLEFRNPHTWKLIKNLPLPCNGPDHMDFSANGKYALIGCEFDGRVVRFDPARMKVTGVAHVGGLPVDVKLSPDGKVFYVANQGLGGVSIVDPKRMKVVKFLKTARGAHGMAVSRNTRFLYVSNRLAGSISVIDFDRRRVVHTWEVGGSPDMLQVSSDGSELWFSNRFGTTITVMNTSNGHVIKRIEVGADPHGLAFFPQPGRFSLGHNGVYR